MKKARQTISENDVMHLAELARIEVSKKEIEKLRVQLNEIIEYFKKIDEVNTESAVPTYHVQELVNVLREDEPQNSESEILLSNVPLKKGRLIKAPKMI